jgi:hypothetical protein
MVKKFRINRKDLKNEKRAITNTLTPSFFPQEDL